MQDSSDLLMFDRMAITRIDEGIFAMTFFVSAIHRLRATAPVRFSPQSGTGWRLPALAGALPQPDDHLLRDTGLTRCETEAEARRKAWDAPPHWQG